MIGGRTDPVIGGEGGARVLIGGTTMTGSTISKLTLIISLNPRSILNDGEVATFSKTFTSGDNSGSDGSKPVCISRLSDFSEQLRTSVMVGRKSFVCGIERSSSKSEENVDVEPFER